MRGAWRMGRREGLPSTVFVLGVKFNGLISSIGKGLTW